MEFTVSVRSRHVPDMPRRPCAWPPRRPSVPTSRATRVTSSANARQLVDHGVDGVLQLGDLAARVDGDLLREVALGHGRGHLGDVAHLSRQVAGQLVDVVGEVLPRARHALHLGLPAEAALGADLAGDPGDLGRERAQLVDHGVDGVAQRRDLAAGVDADLLRQVAVGHGRRHLGDVAHLGGEVAGQQVDVLRQVLPRARHALDPRLAAEVALGADLAGHAGDLVGEGRQLVDHGVDGVLELEHLAPSRRP